MREKKTIVISYNGNKNVKHDEKNNRLKSKNEPFPKHADVFWFRFKAVVFAVRFGSVLM